MSQLAALVWLKWRLFRNSLRTGKAVGTRLASALAMLAALAFSLLVAFGLGSAAYFFASPHAREHAELSKFAGGALAFFFLVFSFVYLMWAVVPLGLEGGSRFEPRRMMLYPVSLVKLFAVDMVSELTSLSSVFAVPAVAGLALGAGLALKGVGRALLLAALAVCFGVALSKLFASFMGALLRQRRTRGETVLALLGAVLGLSGIFMGQIMERFLPQVGRYEGAFRGLKWTPPGALATGLTDGLRPGGAASYAFSAAALAAYTAAAVAVTYLIARRSALDVGGARAGAARRPRPAPGAEAYAGWRLPLASAELSAVFEKELRYALRNAQLRAVAVMAVALTIVLRMATSRGSLGRSMPAGSVYTEGLRLSYGVLYIFMMTSAITTNLFGYDGAGMRAYVLSPAARRVILLGKNLTTTLIVLVLAAAAVAANALVFGDVTWHAALTSALCFAVFAPAFALGGNWLSMRFPKRVKFGQRMNRTGVAGLLLIPFMLALAVPPAAAAFVSYVAGSAPLKYAILALFALASAAFYALTLAAQAESLARREVEIMEAVTGRGETESGQVLG